jgi:phenylpropionate dioxygenase-like ring-hydroxylating dioxygenase large terminal subunit
MSHFCNPEVTIEAWYAASKSSEVEPGKAIRLTIGSVPIIVRRYTSGALVASQRYCPHMGADLMLAHEEKDETIRCAFHGLKYDKEGCCVSGGTSKHKFQLRTYSVQEKYGLIWVYIGGTPKYEIPEMQLSRGRYLKLPSRKIRAHHHIVISNPLDKVHVLPIHTLQVHTYKLERKGVNITTSMTGTYRSKWMKFLMWSGADAMPIVFATHGPSISTVDAQWDDTRVVLIFTGRQDEQNLCATNTVVWMNTSNPIKWIRALSVIFLILIQDVRILNSIHVSSNFTPEDEGMIAFKDVVDAMPLVS